MYTCIYCVLAYLFEKESMVMCASKRGQHVWEIIDHYSSSEKEKQLFMHVPGQVVFPSYEESKCWTNSSKLDHYTRPNSCTTLMLDKVGIMKIQRWKASWLWQAFFFVQFYGTLCVRKCHFPNMKKSRLHSSSIWPEKRRGRVTKNCNIPWVLTAGWEFNIAQLRHFHGKHDMKRLLDLL